jgi:hypothetical protein
LAKPIARRFGVSPAEMRIRLESLGLLLRQAPTADLTEGWPLTPFFEDKSQVSTEQARRPRRLAGRPSADRHLGWGRFRWPQLIAPTRLDISGGTPRLDTCAKIGACRVPKLGLPSWRLLAAGRSSAKRVRRRSICPPIWTHGRRRASASRGGRPPRPRDLAVWASAIQTGSSSRSAGTIRLKKMRPLTNSVGHLAPAMRNSSKSCATCMLC